MTVERCNLFGTWALEDRLGIRFLDRAMHLSLRGAQYSDDVVPHICQLRHLEVIELTGTRITDGGLSRIRHELPHCQIHLAHTTKTASGAR